MVLVLLLLRASVPACTDGKGAPTSSLLRPPSVNILGCSCIMAPSRAKVSF